MTTYMVSLQIEATDEADALARVTAFGLDSDAGEGIQSVWAPGHVVVPPELAPPTPPPVTGGGRTLTACDPDTGPKGGGTLVTLTGTGLTGIGGVKFGNGWALENDPVDDTTYRCKTPNGTGTVDVILLDGDLGGAILSQGFTYE